MGCSRLRGEQQFFILVLGSARPNGSYLNKVINIYTGIVRSVAEKGVL